MSDTPEIAAAKAALATHWLDRAGDGWSHAAVLLAALDAVVAERDALQDQLDLVLDREHGIVVEMRGEITTLRALLAGARDILCRHTTRREKRVTIEAIAAALAGEGP